jgi:hypothetical protein
MIFFSSSEVYGDYEGSVRGCHGQARDQAVDDYAMTKWVGEMQIATLRCLVLGLFVYACLYHGLSEFYSPSAGTAFFATAH